MGWNLKKLTKIIRDPIGSVVKTVTGGLDAKGAIATALIAPTLSTITHPRETLIAGGAVAVGSYLAGATAAASTPTVAAGGAGVVAAAAPVAAVAAPVTVAAVTVPVAAAAGSVSAVAATAAATSIGSKLIDKGADFVVESAVMATVAKNKQKSIESNYAANLSNVQDAPVSGGLTPVLAIAGGIGLLIALAV